MQWIHPRVRSQEIAARAAESLRESRGADADSPQIQASREAGASRKAGACSTGLAGQGPDGRCLGRIDAATGVCLFSMVIWQALITTGTKYYYEVLVHPAHDPRDRWCARADEARGNSKRAGR